MSGRTKEMQKVQCEKNDNLLFKAAIRFKVMPTLKRSEQLPLPPSFASSSPSCLLNRPLASPLSPLVQRMLSLVLLVENW